MILRLIRNDRSVSGRGLRLVAARMLFLVRADVTSARAQGRIATIRIQGRLHRHTSSLSSHSVGGEFSRVDTGWVCLQQSGGQVTSASKNNNKQNNK